MRCKYPDIRWRWCSYRCRLCGIWRNYYLSPRISAKTIELNAGVAFGAAMAGGAVGGFIGAFFALPIAATIQTFLSTYSKTYELVDPALSDVDEPAKKPPGTKRLRRAWHRRSKSDVPTEEGHER